MKKTIIILLFALIAPMVQLLAQYCSPTLTYTDDKDVVQTLTETSEMPTCNAPLDIVCEANPSEEVSGYNATYEWHFVKDQSNSDYLVRYEENTSYTMLESGTYYIRLNATFKDAKDSIVTTYQSEAIKLAIAASVLQMPNAFSPNGDGHNDRYQAKKTVKSIIEFKATIFNRWGQKLYEWDDPYSENAGWDGTYCGHDVAQGVYYVRVDAKGADGTEYHYRRDVNLLRGYDETNSTNSTQN